MDRYKPVPIKGNIDIKSVITGIGFFIGSEGLQFPNIGAGIIISLILGIIVMIISFIIKGI
jgi:hypothetical protein